MRIATGSQLGLTALGTKPGENREAREKKVLTENKTTQNRPKQHRARDETQEKEKRSARTSKAENTQKGKPKGKREKEKTPTMANFRRTLDTAPASDRPLLPMPLFLTHPPEPLPSHTTQALPE
jgi:hypothetical protein